MLQTIHLAGDLGLQVAQICRLLATCRWHALRAGALGATAQWLQELRA